MFLAAHVDSRAELPPSPSPARPRVVTSAAPQFLCSSASLRWRLRRRTVLLLRRHLTQRSRSAAWRSLLSSRRRRRPPRSAPRRVARPGLGLRRRRAWGPWARSWVCGCVCRGARKWSPRGAPITSSQTPPLVPCRPRRTLTQKSRSPSQTPSQSSAPSTTRRRRPSQWSSACASWRGVHGVAGCLWEPPLPSCAAVTACRLTPPPTPPTLPQLCVDGRGAPAVAAARCT